jgi:hypothetical protein
VVREVLADVVQRGGGAAMPCQKSSGKLARESAASPSASRPGNVSPTLAHQSGAASHSSVVVIGSTRPASHARAARASVNR